MHQILQDFPYKGKRALRPFKNKKNESPQYPDIIEIFKDSNRYAEIENLRFTLLNTPKNIFNNVTYLTKEIFKVIKEKSTINTFSLEFDSIPTENLLRLTEQIGQALGIPHSQFALQHTGHGIHIYIPLSHPIPIPQYNHFRQHHYADIYRKIAQKANIPPSCWDIGGLSTWASYGRVPNTTNKKPHKPPSHVIPLNTPTEKSEITWEKIIKYYTGKEINLKGEFIRIQAKKPEPTPEKLPKSITQCNLVTSAISNPEKLPEPERFSLARILHALPKGKNLIHEIAKRKESYNETDENTRIDRASKFARPTCKAISETTDACRTCPLRGVINSPLDLVAQDKWEPIIKLQFRKLKSNGEISDQVDFTSLIKYISETKTEIRANPPRTALYQYQDNMWVEIDRMPLFAEIVHPLIGIIGQQMLTAPRVVYEQLLVAARLLPPSAINPTPGKVYLQNGILDMVTLELEPHTPETSSTFIVPHAWTPPTIEQEMKWQNYLDGVCNAKGQDNGKQNALQEFFGSVLLGDTPTGLNRMLILYGPSKNGKSVFAHIMENFFAPQNVSAFDYRRLNDQTNYTMLKSLLSIDWDAGLDNPKYARDDGLLKKIITGEKVTIKKLFYDSYTSQLKTKLVMLTNTLPRSPDKTGGFYRRLLIVPFENYFGKNADENIAETIPQTCAPAILRWAIDGHKRLRANGGNFTLPSGHHQHLVELKKESDSVTEFLDDSLTPDPDILQPISPYHTDQHHPWQLIPITELYLEYRKHAELAGTKNIVRRIEFKKRTITWIEESDREFWPQWRPYFRKSARLGGKVCLIGHDWIKDKVNKF